MTVSELIAALQKMPADATIMMLWDGAARTIVATAWEARDGYVVIAPEDDYVYDLGDRPKSAASWDDDRYPKTWQIAGLPEPTYDE